MRRVAALTLLVAIAASGCGASSPASSGPARAEIPVRPAPSRARHDPANARVRETPPQSTSAKPSPFPRVFRKTLPNGLGVVVAEAHTLPIVQIRVVVRAGMGYGSAPGAAEITAQLLKDGGTRTMTSERLLERVETLGSQLGVDVDLDRTVLSMPVTRDHVEEAIAILGEVVQAPRFDEKELRKLKARELDDVEDKARADATWSATQALLRELYPRPHPYASLDLTPPSIAGIGGAMVRDFYRRFYVPNAAEVVLVGDIDAAEATALVEKTFGAWKRGEAPQVTFAPPLPLAKRRVVVAHRPKSAQSDVFVVSLIPARTAPEWPSIRVVSQALGGGPASRLFQDVREKRSLAYATRTSVVELAHGAQPLIAYAGTQTPKTALAVEAILDAMKKMASAPLSPQEVATAARFLGDAFAIRLETIGSIADAIVAQDTYGLPDGYWDSYRASVRAVTPAEASRESSAILGGEHVLIVVAGDADAIAPTLRRFGDVTVVDPENDFQPLSTIPADPTAPLDSIDARPRKE